MIALTTIASFAKMLKPYWAHILAAIVVIFCLYKSHSAAYHWGESVVQKKWDTATLGWKQEIDRLKTNYAVKEKTYRDENRILTYQLAQANEKYQADLAAIDAGYAERLRDSEERSRLYQRAANAGTAESNRLASYASELDAALTAGRRLVAKLRTTLKQRDEQIAALARQIRSDRALFE